MSGLPRFVDAFEIRDGVAVTCPYVGPVRRKELYELAHRLSDGCMDVLLYLPHGEPVTQAHIDSADANRRTAAALDELRGERAANEDS